MKKIIIAAITLSITSASAAETEVKAPFGFEWGMTKAQLEKSIELKNCKEIGPFSECASLKAIKPVSFGSAYGFLISKDKGLHKVIMVSNIKSDLYGKKGKDLYSKISKSLTKKYGASDSYESIGAKVYKKSDEFYQCLKYDGCGVWTSFWSAPKNGGDIVMEIKGAGRGKGFIRLTYESKDLGLLLDEWKEQQSSVDSDAL